MKLSPQEKKELLRLVKSRSNRRAFHAARESTRCRTFDEFIAALDDAQAVLGSVTQREPRFVAYTFVPF